MEDELLQKHRQERKELQSKIQSLKHSIAKGDKKKKKEITEEVARLELELEERQNLELKNFKENVQVNNVSNQLENCVLSGNTNQVNGDISIKAGKSSKAMKRREKKANKQRERDELIAQQELDNLTSDRNLEAKALKEILGKRSLAIQEIPSDGNCLYVAVEHQLSKQNITTSMQSLRCQVSEYMLSHEDDFLPFLSHPESGEPFSQEQYKVYCKDIATKPVWGGHLELQALSCVLKQPIEVIQADGPIVKLGEQFLDQPIILSYHKHVYGLGEHYNSVIPESLVEEDEWIES